MPVTFRAYAPGMPASTNGVAEAMRSLGESTVTVTLEMQQEGVEGVFLLKTATVVDRTPLVDAGDALRVQHGLADPRGAPSLTYEVVRIGPSESMTDEDLRVETGEDGDPVHGRNSVTFT